MASYEIIADVSRNLLELLRENLSPEPINNAELIGLCTPVEPGNFVLGLNIYDVEEKKDLGTQNSVNLRPGLIKDPPTPLMLYYMLTVYSKTELANRAVDEQRIMGKAMQVLNDNRKLRGEQLLGSLQANHSQLSINKINLSMDEKVKIWSLYNQTYRISSYYQVGPVYLESDKIRDTQPVTEFRVDMKGKKHG